MSSPLSSRSHDCSSSSWTCSRCTYQHDPPKENDYLRCAMCGSEQNEWRNIDESSSSSSSSSAATTTHTCQSTVPISFFTPRKSTSTSMSIQNTNANANANANTAMTTTMTRKLEKKRSSMKKRKATKIESSSSSSAVAAAAAVIAASDTTTLTTMKSSPSPRPPQQQQQQQQRNLFDVLKPRTALSFLPYGARIRRNDSSGTDKSSSSFFDISIDDMMRMAKDGHDDNVLHQRYGCPMTVVYNVLPKQVAGRLLDQLEKTSPTWNKGNWIVHGKKYSIPRTTATFYLNNNKSKSSNDIRNNHNDGNINSNSSSSSGINHSNNSSNSNNKSNSNDDNDDDDDDDDGEYYDENKIQRTISKEMLIAADCIADAVRLRQQRRRRRRQCSLPPFNDNSFTLPTNNDSINNNRKVDDKKEEEEEWKPNFILANRYQDGNDCVGWHSDHMTKLGLRPIIVGLSLGACRRFEMKRTNDSDNTDDEKINGNDDDDDDDATNSYEKKKNQKQATPTTTHISVYMPHNSIVIMWDNAQESWQHSVPKCSDSSTGMNHSRVGTTRISLTFRMRKAFFNTIVSTTRCYCGKPVGLKCNNKDGKYYLFCEPYGKNKHKTCNYWKPLTIATEGK